MICFAERQLPVQRGVTLEGSPGQYLDSVLAAAFPVHLPVSVIGHRQRHKAVWAVWIKFQALVQKHL